MANDVLEIPMKILSGNILIRKHWAVRNREKQTWALLVRNQMKLNNIKKVKVGQVCSIVITGTRRRELDFDNFVGGCKQLIDALSRERFIWDDDMKHLGIPKFIQNKCKKGEEPSVLIIRSYEL